MRKFDKKMAQVKKSLKDFVVDEDGFVSKESMLKVGLWTVVGIGVLGAGINVAGQTAITHTNVVKFEPPATGGPACLTPAAATHTNSGSSTHNDTYTG